MRFSFNMALDVAYWCPLTVAARNATLALFLGARVSSRAAWWCWALWMGLWVSHHRDATPGFLKHLSVQWHGPQSHVWRIYCGFHIVWKVFFFFFLSVFENIYQKIDQAHQPLIYSPEPTNMLQSAPVRVTNLPLCIWHRKNSPNKGINTNFVFPGRHNIYAVLQVTYFCKSGFNLFKARYETRARRPVPMISCHPTFSLHWEYREGVEGSA